MRLHRNAKTTPHMRALLVRRIRRQRWSPSAAAAAAGISVRSKYKWLARYREGGRAALQDRPSTPHGQPRRTKPAVTARILAARAARQTAWAIAVQVQVPRSTVAAILVRAGLNRLARLTAPPPVRRYEWPRPGDMVHLDVKPLARIAGVGHRIHGDRRARVKGMAGNMRTSRLMITVAPRMSKCCPIKPVERRPGFSTVRSRGLRSAAYTSPGCWPTTAETIAVDIFRPRRRVTNCG